MTIALDFYRDLPKVRAAFDAGTLQMQTDPGNIRCAYDGPCAIGVMLTPEQRDGIVYQSQYEKVLSLVDRGVLDMPREQQADAQELQDTHDACMGGEASSPTARAEFVELLQKLEAKYLTTAKAE